jgi:SAM-dependent methyltransferase
MTREPTLGRVASLYEDSLAQHGLSSKGVGWPDDASHRQRFLKLATVVDSSDGPISVNDLGCGYGAFWNFLSENDVSLRHFRGYDISERMIENARQRVPSAEFVVGDKLDQEADYGFACGIFNVRFDESEENWRAYIRRTLDNLHDFSGRGFAFNLLSTYVDFRRPHLFYGDPSEFFHLCKTRYSRRVALLHDYPLFEWTITVSK